MKLDLLQLKKAVQWIEANTNEVLVKVYMSEANKFSIKCTDKYDSEVEITLTEEGTSLPKIKKTEIL